MKTFNTKQTNTLFFSPLIYLSNDEKTTPTVIFVRNGEHRTTTEKKTLFFPLYTVREKNVYSTLSISRIYTENKMSAVARFHDPLVNFITVGMSEPLGLALVY